MQKLPPPTNFTEGLRLVFSLAAMLAGLAFGLGLIALVIVLVWGGWPENLFGQIIEILGAVAIGSVILIGITQVGMLLGGPVGRIKGSAGKGGVTLEAENNEQQRTTEVDVKVKTGTEENKDAPSSN